MDSGTRIERMKRIGLVLCAYARRSSDCGLTPIVNRSNPFNPRSIFLIFCHIWLDIDY